MESQKDRRNLLESDAKLLGGTVEVDTLQLEQYLRTIQETLNKHEATIKLVPVISRKLDLCVLDVDVIRDKIYQQQAAADVSMHYHFITMS